MFHFCGDCQRCWFRLFLGHDRSWCNLSVSVSLLLQFSCFWHVLFNFWEPFPVPVHSFVLLMTVNVTQWIHAVQHHNWMESLVLICFSCTVTLGGVYYELTMLLCNSFHHVSSNVPYNAWLILWITIFCALYFILYCSYYTCISYDCPVKTMYSKNSAFHELRKTAVFSALGTVNRWFSLDSNNVQHPNLHL